MRESKRRERGTCNRRLSRAAADNQSRGPRLTGAEPQAPVVLIVDDEEPIAETAGWIVEAQGYLPLLAYNGQHALELARTRWPAVLITDWMMPQMDGVELIRARYQSQHCSDPLRQLRSDPPKHTPVSSGTFPSSWLA